MTGPRRTRSGRGRSRSGSGGGSRCSMTTHTKQRLSSANIENLERYKDIKKSSVRYNKLINKLQTLSNNPKYDTEKVHKEQRMVEYAFANYCHNLTKHKYGPKPKFDYKTKPIADLKRVKNVTTKISTKPRKQKLKEKKAHQILSEFDDTKGYYFGIKTDKYGDMYLNDGVVSEEITDDTPDELRQRIRDWIDTANE